MDFEGLRAVLGRIHRGELRLVARDTPEPSVFAHEILNAKPYAFLDDAPLEERRSHAVQTRRAERSGLGRGSWRARCGRDCTRARGGASGSPRCRRAARRAADRGVSVHWRVGGRPAGAPRGVEGGAAGGQRGLRRIDRHAPDRRRGRAAARVARDPSGPRRPAVAATARVSAREILDAQRGHRGSPERPTDADRPDYRAGVGGSTRHFARGSRRGAPAARSGRRGAARTLYAWRDRARMVRPDAARPHSSLHVEQAARRDRAGQPGGLHALPLPLAARRDIVQADRARRPAGGRRGARRIRARGRRVGARGAAGAARSVRAVDARHDLPRGRGRMGRGSRLRPARAARRPAWCRRRRLRSSCASMRARGGRCGQPRRSRRSARQLDACCRCSGRVGRRSSPISPQRAGSMPTSCGMRSARWSPAGWRRRMGSRDCARSSGRRAAARRSTIVAATSPAGGRPSRRRGEAVTRDEAIELQAWSLLRRYGVVFRRLLTRETNAATWRELARVYRRLEARGEIRSGRFVTGMSGEQFALPDAVERLREVRRIPADGGLVTISAADPLNLTGIVTAGERIRTAGRNRIVYRDGVPARCRGRRLRAGACADRAGHRRRRVARTQAAACAARSLSSSPSAVR